MAIGLREYGSKDRQQAGYRLRPSAADAVVELDRGFAYSEGAWSRCCQSATRDMARIVGCLGEGSCSLVSRARAKGTSQIAAGPAAVAAVHSTWRERAAQSRSADVSV